MTNHVNLPLVTLADGSQHILVQHNPIDKRAEEKEARFWGVVY